jgi:hypothetical protein
MRGLEKNSENVELVGFQRGLGVAQQDGVSKS